MWRHHGNDLFRNLPQEQASAHVESTFTTMVDDTQLDMNRFSNGLTPVEMVNNVFIHGEDSQEMRQPEQTNFASQRFKTSPNQAGRNCEMKHKMLPMTNSGAGLCLRGQQHFCGLQTGQLNEIDGKATKRKSDDNYNPYPVWKQHITDEKMAARMNNLYIANDHNYYNTNNPVFTPDNPLNMVVKATQVLPGCATMESQSDCEDRCDTGQNGTMEPRRDHPVFQFNAPLEQFMKRKNDILPRQIIEEIYKPCLAVIPWTPPLNNNIEEEFISKENQDKKVNKKT